LAGAERTPAIANWIMAAALIVSPGLYWYTSVIGLLLFAIGH
jgi:type IV secretory pathway TrbD component